MVTNKAVILFCCISFFTMNSLGIAPGKDTITQGQPSTSQFRPLQTASATVQGVTTTATLIYRAQEASDAETREMFAAVASILPRMARNIAAQKTAQATTKK